MGSSRSILGLSAVAALWALTAFPRPCPAQNPIWETDGIVIASHAVDQSNPTVFTDGAHAAEYLRQGPCRFALLDTRNERSFANTCSSM